MFKFFREVPTYLNEKASAETEGRKFVANPNWESTKRVAAFNELTGIQAKNSCHFFWIAFWNYPIYLATGKNLRLAGILANGLPFVGVAALFLGLSLPLRHLTPPSGYTGGLFFLNIITFYLAYAIAVGLGLGSTWLKRQKYKYVGKQGTIGMILAVVSMLLFLAQEVVSWQTLLIPTVIILIGMVGLAIGIQHLIFKLQEKSCPLVEYPETY